VFETIPVKNQTELRTPFGVGVVVAGTSSETLIREEERRVTVTSMIR